MRGEDTSTVLVSSGANASEHQLAAAIISSTKPPSTSTSPKVAKRKRSYSNSSSESLVRQSLDTTEMEVSTEQLHLPEPLLNGNLLNQVLDVATEKEKSSSGPITPPPSTTNRSPKRSQSFKDQLLQRFNNSVSLSGSNYHRKVQTATNGGHSPVIRDQRRHVTSPSTEEPRNEDDSDGGKISPIQLINGHKRSNSNVQSDAEGTTSSSQRSSTSSPSNIIKITNNKGDTKPQKFTRSRHGSLRNNPVVQVLPDKKLLNKASSSENINAISDLSALTSLVQRKRDSSQESLDQIGNGDKPHFHVRQRNGVEDNSNGTADYGIRPMRPINIPRRPANKSRAPKPPPVPKNTTDETTSPVHHGSDTPDHTDDQDSGPDEQWDLETPADQRVQPSLEMLQQDASQRPVPQIRNPTARIANRPLTSRDASPSKVLSNSPPKSVSFNPTNELYTFEEESSDHRRRSKRSSDRSRRALTNNVVESQSNTATPSIKLSGSHRQVASSTTSNAIPTKASDLSTLSDRYSLNTTVVSSKYSISSSTIGCRTLIESHKICLKTMQHLVEQKLHLVQCLESGQISIEEYRETMNQLLALHTNNIGMMVNNLQGNEVYHQQNANSPTTNNHHK